jgi:hypothetical protein
MPEFAPVWLEVDDVKEWLRIAGADTVDDALLARCCAAVEPQVQRNRPDMWVPAATVGRDARGHFTAATVETYVPDAEVYQAAGMLAAKMYRRRNSPGGVESFGDTVLYPARWDAEIDRALRTAGSRLPAVG